jgi:hypothetical protein
VPTEREKAGVYPRETQAAHDPSGAPRRDYAAPVLTRLGDLRTLTMGTTPGFQDSGGPPGYGLGV